MAEGTATNWRKIIGCLCIILIIAGIAVGLGVGLSMKKSKSTTTLEEGPPLLGDHLLSDAQQQILNDSLQLPAGNQSVAAASISLTALLWPSSTILYQYHANLPAALKENARVAMQRISEASCLKFVQRSSNLQNNFLYFEPYTTDANGGACQSVVGVNGNSYNAITMGQYCDPGRCIHEILHALGFNHEHVRPDRNRFVTFRPENIDPKLQNRDSIARTNFAIVGSTTTNTPYDLLSIMHYPLNGFAAPGKQVLTLVDPNFSGRDQVGQLKVLSEGDKAALNALYCGNVQPTPPPTPAPTSPDAATGYIFIPCVNNSQCPPGPGTCTTGKYCGITGRPTCTSHNDCLMGQYCATSGVCTVCIGPSACSPTSSITGICDACSAKCVNFNSPAMPQNTGQFSLVGAFNYRAWYRATINRNNVHLFWWNNLWVVSYSAPTPGVIPDGTHFSSTRVLLASNATGWNRAISGQWRADTSVTISLCP